MKDDENNTNITYITLFEASQKWEIHQSKIIKLCEDRKIKGAAKLSNKWIIPSETEKPIIETTTTLVRPVVAKNKVQETVLKHVEKGENFYTREIVIDNKTFIVSSIFPKQGRTVEETSAKLVLRKLEEFENIKLTKKEKTDFLANARKNSDAANMTFEKYIEIYRNEFKRYGFSDEDIAVLLERKALDYEDFEL